MTGPDVRSAAQLGPNARRALAPPVEGAKRRKVLVLVAAFIDAGRVDPSISELAARAKLHRGAVVRLVDRLEREGLLTVHRCPNERNRYTLPDRGRR